MPGVIVWRAGSEDVSACQRATEVSFHNAVIRCYSDRTGAQRQSLEHHLHFLLRSPALSPNANAHAACPWTGANGIAGKPVGSSGRGLWHTVSTNNRRRVEQKKSLRELRTHQYHTGWHWAWTRSLNFHELVSVLGERDLTVLFYCLMNVAVNSFVPVSVNRVPDSRQTPT